MSYVRKPPNSNVPNQPYNYKKDLQNFNVDGLKLPLPVKQIPKFEAQNKEFSVNVYALDEIKSKTRDNKAILFPLYNTKERNRKYHANLLLITSGDKRHYVVIKSLIRLLAGRTADTSGRQSFVCKFCLYSFSSELLLEKHRVSCSEHAAVTAEFPVEPMNILKFKNFSRGSIRYLCGLWSYLSRSGWQREQIHEKIEQTCALWVCVSDNFVVWAVQHRRSRGLFGTRLYVEILQPFEQWTFEDEQDFE